MDKTEDEKITRTGQFSYNGGAGTLYYHPADDSPAIELNLDDTNHRMLRLLINYPGTKLTDSSGQDRPDIHMAVIHTLEKNIISKIREAASEIPESIIRNQFHQLHLTTLERQPIQNDELEEKAGFDPQTGKRLLFRPQDEVGAMAVAKGARVPDTFSAATRSASLSPNRPFKGWTYYSGSDILGFRTFPSIKKECPHREKLIKLVTGDPIHYDTENLDELLETMLWLTQNPFKGNPVEVLKDAFADFPDEAQQTFFERNTPARLGSGRISGIAKGITFLPEMRI